MLFPCFLLRVTIKLLFIQFVPAMPAYLIADRSQSHHVSSAAGRRRRWRRGQRHNSNPVPSQNQKKGRWHPQLTVYRCHEMKRTTAFPLRSSSGRRGSASSDEPDFFDLPEEPCLAIAKRQLRRVRVWVIFVVFIVFVLYLRREPPPPPPLPHIRFDQVDWSRYAYSQYATSSAYLCNAVMVFESLHRLGSRAQRVLFYPENWDIEIADKNDRDSQLLVLARDKFEVLLVPIDLDLVKEGSG